MRFQCIIYLSVRIVICPVSYLISIDVIIKENGTCCTSSIFRHLFSGEPTGSEEFLNQMVETLGIIIDRCPKGRPRKMES